MQPCIDRHILLTFQSNFIALYGARILIQYAAFIVENILKITIQNIIENWSATYTSSSRYYISGVRFIVKLVLFALLHGTCGLISNI